MAGTFGKLSRGFCVFVYEVGNINGVKSFNFGRDLFFNRCFWAIAYKIMSLSPSERIKHGDTSRSHKAIIVNGLRDNELHQPYWEDFSPPRDNLMPSSKPAVKAQPCASPKGMPCERRENRDRNVDDNIFILSKTTPPAKVVRKKRARDPKIVTVDLDPPASRFKADSKIERVEETAMVPTLDKLHASCTPRVPCSIKFSFDFNSCSSSVSEASRIPHKKTGRTVHFSADSKTYDGTGRDRVCSRSTETIERTNAGAGREEAEADTCRSPKPQPLAETGRSPKPQHHAETDEKSSVDHHVPP